MNVDYLVVGQGIAGTMLSYSLMQAGASVLVIDEYKENSSSRVAAGVVNPVSGRRFTVAWLYDEIYPIALRTYREMEDLLGLPVYKERDLWTVLPTEQLKTAFFDRTTGLDYMRLPSDAAIAHYDQWLDQPYGAAVIRGGTVLLQQLLPIWREYLKKHNSLLEERFQPSNLQAKSTSVTYGDIHAKALIFCDGAQTPHNPWFSSIPFLLNKGEVLTVRVPGFETADIVKRSISMVPIPGQNDIYWVGATFAWDYPDENPTAEKRAFLENGLQQLLKVPYEVLDHQAAVRPSGTDRRPMLGMHPEIPSLGLFNGLGTKGSSLAPAMAAQMTAHLLRNAPLWQETDIKRFFNRYKG